MVLAGRIPRGVARQQPPRTCYCDSCTPVREQIEMLRNVLRRIQAGDGHSYKSHTGREICNRSARTPEQLAAKRESDARYRVAHKEARRDYDAKYRQQNLEKIRARSREWRKTHPHSGGKGKASSEAKQRAARRTKRLNAASRDAARRSGYVWTGPEMEIAARNDLPVPQLAKMLGRTIASVYTMRAQLRREPKFQQVAGLPERESA